MKGKRIAMKVTISMSRIVIRGIVIRLAIRTNMNHEGDRKDKKKCDQKNNDKLSGRYTQG
jgi:hypothetical protein